MENYSLSDVAAATSGKEKGAFGSDGLWVFALLLLLFGSGGGFFGGSAASNAMTQADLCMNSQFQNLNQNVNDIGQRQFMQANEHTKDIATASAAMLTGFDTVGSKIDNCCCETNRNIDSVKFDMANYVASINATSTANAQKILDKMCENQMSAMQNEIQTLKLQQAMCGVPKVNPYGYGIVPTFNGCGNLTNI